VATVIRYLTATVIAEMIVVISVCVLAHILVANIALVIFAVILTGVSKIGIALVALAIYNCVIATVVSYLTATVVAKMIVVISIGMCAHCFFTSITLVILVGIYTVVIAARRKHKAKAKCQHNDHENV